MRESTIDLADAADAESVMSQCESSAPASIGGLNKFGLSRSPRSRISPSSLDIRLQFVVVMHRFLRAHPQVSLRVSAHPWVRDPMQGR